MKIRPSKRGLRSGLYLAALLASAPATLTAGADDVESIAEIDRATSFLKSVLERAEFQPHPKPLSWQQKLMQTYASFIERIRDTIADYFQSIRDWLHKSWDSTGVSLALPRWLEDVFTAIAGCVAFIYQAVSAAAPAILIAALIGVLAFLIYRLVNKTWRPSELFPEKSASSLSTPALLPLSEIFERGDPRALLEALRQHLRFHLGKKFGISAATSDRRFVACVPGENTASNLFRETVGMFEKCAFAKQTPDFSQMKTLYERYRALNFHS